jgi:hypothetical protein
MDKDEIKHKNQGKLKKILEILRIKLEIKLKIVYIVT